MKKTNFFYASAIMMACAFGIQSCTVEDNPSNSINPAKTIYTYDFAAAFNMQENPANLNGSTSNGGVFYGWESDSKTDSKRQDYKGYAWATGSVLPEICHVWRRSDRINGNIKEGGLYCPNDREMAIDGLKEGSAVQIFYDAPLLSKQISLQEVPFQTWDGWVNANPTGNGYGAFVLNESTGLPYGDGNVINYSDLSEYTKLIVVCTDGTPRFLFNRDENEGQWKEDENESHLIEYPKGDGVWSAKYFKVEDVDGGKKYTVDLAQMVADKGYAHLHAIKGANWQNCTITSMMLETKPIYPDNIIWAIGVGNDGPRATADIEGVNAALVSGQTEIPSGAKILVKSVTPAEKGTGYIVVKVKKGMVITKVVIDDAAE